MTPLQTVSAVATRAVRGRNATSPGDTIYKAVLTIGALSIPVLLVFLAVVLHDGASEAIDAFGIRFLISSVWDPVAGEFGARALLIGTLLTAFLALLMAVPLSLGVAIYLTEFAPTVIRRPIATVIELLAAIPSVVYGLWGIFVLIPFLRSTAFPVLRDTLGFLPIFSGPIYGPSVLSASIILAIMVMPYIMSVSHSVLLAVPDNQREAALALGATRWEAVTSSILPFARSGIIGSIVLGLGRALGETMAVTMLIGNRHELPTSLFAPGYTMASVIANEFREQTSELHGSALVYVALLLFLVTVVINTLARLLIKHTSRATSVGGGR